MHDVQFIFRLPASPPSSKPLATAKSSAVIPPGTWLVRRNSNQSAVLPTVPKGSQGVNVTHKPLTTAEYCNCLNDSLRGVIQDMETTEA